MTTLIIYDANKIYLDAVIDMIKRREEHGVKIFRVANKKATLSCGEGNLVYILPIDDEPVKGTVVSLILCPQYIKDTDWMKTVVEPMSRGAIFYYNEVKL